MPCRDLLHGLIAAQRLQRDLILKPVCRLPARRHSRIPSWFWETTQLQSSFPGPLQPCSAIGLSCTLCIATCHAVTASLGHKCVKDTERAPPSHVAQRLDSPGDIGVPEFSIRKAAFYGPHNRIICP